MSITETLRLSARAAAVAATTGSMYAAFEAEAAMAGASRRPEVLSKWVHRYGRLQLATLGAHIQGEGPHVGPSTQYPGAAPNGKGRVFVMNHRSALDILVGLTFFQARILSRGDLAKWPVIGVLARRIGTLFVDRGSTMSGARAAAAMVRAVEAGLGILVFPEGTTYEGDEVRPFRLGAFTVACRTGTEVVPAGIAYREAHAFFGDEGFGAHMKRVVGQPATHAVLTTGEPIQTQGRSPDDVLAEAQSTVQSLVDRSRALAG